MIKKPLVSFLVIILLVCLVIISAVTILAPQLLKKQLENIFVGSRVEVAGCRFSSFTELIISGIVINNEPAYAFKVKDLVIDYTLPEFPKVSISRVTLSGLDIRIDLMDKGIADLSKRIKLKPSGAVPINAFDLSEAIFDVKSKDLNFDAALSIGLDLKNRALTWLDLKVKSADISGLKLRGGLLSAGGASRVNSFTLNEMSFDKLRLLKASAEPILKDKHFYLSNIRCSLFDGFLNGELDLVLADKMRCSADLKFSGIDLAAFIKDFKLKDKLELSGSLDGYIVLEADSSGINNLEGDFKVRDPGGALTIKDDSYLKELAKNTGEGIDFVVESFTNYSYNKGLMRMYLDNNSIVMDAGLDGVSGKRNLTVILHNILKRSEK